MALIEICRKKRTIQEKYQVEHLGTTKRVMEIETKHFLNQYVMTQKFKLI